jgi:GNAT superfamily N-acetyltransferase
VTAHFESALARFRAARASDLGCDVAAFDSHVLTIVPKPETTKQPYVLVGMTFGTGTVLSAEPAYLDWVRGNAPEPHYRAMFPFAMFKPLADEAERRGERLDPRFPNLGFLSGEPARAPELPDGLVARRTDRAWREPLVESAEFDNALGTPGNVYVDSIWRFGVTIFDGDTPAAVAGGYDDGDGLIEIGVDVARAYRGRGLGEAVVRAMAAEIEREGAYPTYYCAPTNVRSHRTALACGFVPVVSGASVGRVTPATQS